MVKLTGAQWKAFYADKNFWPEGRWHDDQIILWNDVPSRVPERNPDEVADTDTVVIEQGDIVQTGKYFCDFVEYAQDWLNKQTTTQMVIRVPNEKVDEAIKLLESAGIELVAKGGSWAL